MGKFKDLQQAKSNQNRQAFLLTFFNGEGYEEKEINGFWLIKQLVSGDQGKPMVAIYTQEAYQKYKVYQTMKI